MNTNQIPTNGPFNTVQIIRDLADNSYVAGFAKQHFADHSLSEFLLACLDGDPRPFLEQLDEEVEARKHELGED